DLDLYQGMSNLGTIILTDISSSGNHAEIWVESGYSLDNETGGSILIEAGDGGSSRYLTGTVNNAGALEVNQGLVIQSGSFSNTGNLFVNAGLTINNSGYTTTFSGGYIDVADGKTMTINGGTLALDGTTTWTGSGTLLLQNTVTVDIAAASALGNSTITTSFDGTVTVSGTTLSNFGTLNIYGGTDTMNAGLVNESGATVIVEGHYYDSADLILNQGMLNSGTLRLTDTSSGGNSVKVSVADGQSLYNVSGGVIDIEVGTGGSARYLDGALENEGTINLNAASTLQGSGVSHSNSGTINVNSGTWTIDLSGSATFTNSGTIAIASGQSVDVNSGTFTNASGGIISGSGTLDTSGSTLINNGTISAGQSPGLLTITGDLVMTDSAALQLELAGEEAGISYDLLVIQGALTLAGTLQLDSLNGFIPESGTVFEMIQAESISGAFDAVSGWSMESGMILDPSWEGDTLTVTARQATIQGSADADTLQGTTAEDIIQSGAGDDRIEDIGENDFVDAGQGNDILITGAIPMAMLDGGSGHDTLMIDGMDLDLTAMDNHRLANIEQIDMSGNSADLVALNFEDLLSLPDTNQLQLDGDANDTVNADLTGNNFVDQGTVDGYHTFSNGLATLLVDDEMGHNVLI
ncbi:MAG: hypothetical protein HQL54_14725, partial [Magnetococcales bacterium]|nr:hypothetical protein [Magnetococcales bacterium]